MKSIISTGAILLLFLLAACQSGVQPSQEGEKALKEKASRLAHQFLLADTHIDVPYRLSEKMEDISKRTEGGNFDAPRARQGGLNLAFMSIYVPASYQKGGARELADQLIDMVEGFVQKWPEQFGLARSPAEARQQFAAGRIALAMGMENGAPIEGKLENLRHFQERGIRYITLTHSKWNHICDSSYDPEKKWGGLSPFGRKVVAEMNRLGIMVDISHVSDDTFFQVVELTQAPIVASHSSCRHFTPGWERNMSDEMLLKLKANGGVIQINFGSSFLNDQYRKAREEGRKEIEAYLKEHQLKEGDEEAKAYTKKYWQEHPLRHADVSEVADHIDHVVQLIGIDHVGIGSDFDGVGDSLPTGLEDVSAYPNLIAELLKRGYSDADIEKICSGNLLRVWSEVERVAAKLQAAG